MFSCCNLMAHFQFMFNVFSSRVNMLLDRQRKAIIAVDRDTVYVCYPHRNDKQETVSFLRLEAVMLQIKPELQILTAVQLHVTDSEFQLYDRSSSTLRRYQLKHHTIAFTFPAVTTLLWPRVVIVSGSNHNS